MKVFSSGTELAHNLRWRSKMRKNSGFSIIELCVAVAIIAIIVSIGLPSLISWRQSAHLGKAARDVYGGLQKAKMEATRNNRFCQFKFSGVNVDGQQYDFFIFIDSNPRNFVYEPGVDTFVTGYVADEYPGVRRDPTKGTNGITFVNESGNPIDYITFAPDGLPKLMNGNLTGGSLFLRDGGRNGRRVRVSVAGTIQISKYDPNP